jgi:transglutaminase-like putative cysteine protease
VYSPPPQEAPQEGKKKKARQSIYPRGYFAKRIAFTLFLLMFLTVAAGAVWYYWWTSYATFEYNLTPIVILEGYSFSPGDFLDNTGDTRDISAVLQNPRFTPSTGRQTVPITLTYGLRSLNTTATLYVMTPLEQITIEFADEENPPIKPVELITNVDVAMTDISRGLPFDVRFTLEPLPLDEYPVGEFDLHLALNDMPFTVLLSVVDTTPPTAIPVHVTIQIGDPVDPTQFVTNVSDASPPLTYTFVNEPDVLSHRDQIVEIVIEDAFGNSETFAASLSIILNTVPPIIEGTTTIESMVGNPIIYRRGVTAFDDFGRELEIHVDDSNVDQHTEGIYTVLYWVQDLTGLRTEVRETVHVIGIDPEYVIQRVDEILADILSDGLTQVEQVRIIFRWIRSNVRYAASLGGPQSVAEGAYVALHERQGNCYIFYSISEVMLTRAGIPNMKIQRCATVPGTTHLWNLINPDGLGWYHYDSLPTRLEFSPLMYMFTSSQAAEFAAQLADPELHGAPTYFTYNPDMYPEIVA